MGFLAAIPAVLGMAGGAAGAAGAAGMSSAAIGLTEAGTAAAAGGQILGGIGQFMAGNAQAKIAKNNARILNAEADDSVIVGSRDESMKRLQVGQAIGEQKAAQGANGVDVAYGSPAQVRDATQTLGDFDAMTIRYNAARQAYGQRVEATNELMKAAQAKASGRMALLSSFIGAAGSTAMGLGKVAAMKSTAGLYGMGGAAGGSAAGAGGMAGAADLPAMG